MFPVLLLVAVAACGGGELRGSLRVDAPLSDVVRAHQALVVRGEGGKPAFTAEAEKLAARLRTPLEGTALFSAVVDKASSSKTEIELVVTVTDLVAVSADERSRLGDSAGQARMVLDVRLREKGTGSPVGAATVEATASEGPRGGTTEDLEDEAIRRIVAWVSGQAAR